MTKTNNEQLRVKSYFASSVQAAMECASRELGADALLLNSRISPPEAKHLGRLEVVFGINKSAVEPPVEVADPNPHPPGSPNELDDLRRQMDEIRTLIKGAVSPAVDRPHRLFIEQALVSAGVEAVLAGEIEQAVASRLGKGAVTDISRSWKPQNRDDDAVLQATVQELAERITTEPKVGRITALVGPPGVGKTTTIVKLAVSQGLTQGRAVRFISADTQRIGAAEQLRTYAAILGAPFQTVEGPAALTQALNALPPETMIFIDTPGLSPVLLTDVGTELATWMACRQDIDTHLVLTACGRAQDLRKASERFAIFRPSRLLFTKLDEAESPGAMYSEAARQGIPLSFFCDGQSIPEDIGTVSKPGLLERLARELPQLLRAAA